MQRTDNPPIVPERETFLGTCKYLLRKALWNCIEVKDDVDDYFDNNVEIVQDALEIDESDDIPNINEMDQDDVTFLDKFRFFLSRIIFGCIDVKETIDENFDNNINIIKDMLDAHEVEAHNTTRTHIMSQGDPIGEDMIHDHVD